MSPPLPPQRPDCEPNPCEAVADAIFDRAAGALGPAETRGLEAHLVGCAACRGLAADLVRTEDTLRGLMVDLAGPEAVGSTARAEDARRSRVWRRPVAGRLAWAAGLVAATGLGVALLWPKIGPTPPHRLARTAELARSTPPTPSAPLAEASDTLRLALLDAFALPE